MTDHLWWQKGIIYQVYPRSFQDTNGDGIGDLEGIRRRLDYLQWLGVDAVWISPVFPSPMKDFGYDISDYTGIHPMFGTMEEFDRLLREAHERGLRVLLDLVPNHTSDQHPWFVESRSSRTSPKRNWYIWADPKPGGGPPNNWLSEFGGGAWEWDEATGQFYYHAFDRSQPDLDWRNPEVHRAMWDVVRFWLDKGVDGFRVDVVWHMVKDAQLRDNPPNPDYDPARHSPYESLVPAYSTDQPDVHRVVAEMRAVFDEYRERLIIAEVYLPISRLVHYYGIERSGAHLPFNFQLVTSPWDPVHIRSVVDEYEASVPAGQWPNWVLGNHDQKRIASRVGRDQARVAAVLLLTLRGTPTMYYGDEIGMTNVPIPPEFAMDPRELNCPGRGLGRDPYRSPMQWDAGPIAGFTTGTPWLPLDEDAGEVNVERQREDPRSMLSLYRRLIALRRAEPALAVGDHVPVEVAPPLMAYVRRRPGATSFLVALNFSGAPYALDLPGPGRVMASALDVGEERDVAGRIELRGHDAVVIALAG